MDDSPASLADRCAAGVRAARAMGDGRNYGGAVASLRGVLRDDPEHVEAHYLLGLYLYALDRRAEARAACEAAVRLAPENAVAHRLLGIVLGSSPWTKARGLRHLDEAVRLAPTDGFNHFYKARALVGLGRDREADAVFRDACARAPEDPTILAGTAEFLFGRRRRREGADFAARAFAAAPDDLSALTAEARSRLFAGRRDDARDLARAAVALHATHGPALALLIETEMCRNPAFALWSRLKAWTGGGRFRGVLLVVLAWHVVIAIMAGLAAAVPDRPAIPVAIVATLVVLPVLPGIVFRRRLAAALRPARLDRRF